MCIYTQKMYNNILYFLWLLFFNTTDNFFPISEGDFVPYLLIYLI